MEVGQIFYSNQPNSKWLVWYEVFDVVGNLVSLYVYGKDTETFETKAYIQDLNDWIKNRVLFPA